jgi:GAF domain-containing protein
MSRTQHDAATVEQLEDLLLDSPDFEQFLDRLAGFSAAVLGGPGILSCTVTVERRHRKRTLAGSDPQAARLDDVQYALDDGPCLAALRTGCPVLVADVGAGQHWHGFLEAAALAGFGSILAVPLPLEGDACAALNCYGRRPGTFTADSIASVQGYAASAAKALILAARLDLQTQRALNLHSALESRTIIDLAVGIVMAQNSCSQDTAFSLLRSASNSRNVKLRDVAQDVVSRVCARASTHFDE